MDLITTTLPSGLTNPQLGNLLAKYLCHVSEVISYAAFRALMRIMDHKEELRSDLVYEICNFVLTLPDNSKDLILHVLEKASTNFKALGGAHQNGRRRNSIRSV